ncbi:hypothetical protein [Amycolatopsis sp. NPDC051128]
MPGKQPSLPHELAELARQWERHVIEVAAGRADGHDTAPAVRSE